MDENGLFVFVLMPFNARFDDIYRLGIKESATNLGFRAERVDEQNYSGSVLERIYRQIELADVVVADMTGQNPNVFYEVGYAHAKGKLCILLTQSVSDIPFDLKHNRHIIYGESISKLKEKLSENLDWAQHEIEKLRRTHIKVKVHNISGELETNKWRATGHVDFKINLVNESAESATEIEAAYFYSTEGWSLHQNNGECPSTASDLSGFHKQHVLALPTRRLHKKGWVQLRFRATKTLAYASKGEVLEDSYKLTAKSILRIVTSEASFDNEIPISVTIDDIPF